MWPCECHERLLLALGFASDFKVGAEKSVAGSVVSQDWNEAGKSMLST